MWAKKGYWMKWHEVINFDAEYQKRVYKPGEGFVYVKTRGVQIPDHCMGRQYLDNPEIAEKVNVLTNQVCGHCRKKKLKEAGITEIML